MNIIPLATCFISRPPESSNGVLLNRFKVMSGATGLLSSIERDFWKFTARLGWKVEGDRYKYRLALSKPTNSIKSQSSLIKGLNEEMTQFWMYAISADFMKTEPCGFWSAPLDCYLLYQFTFNLIHTHTHTHTHTPFKLCFRLIWLSLSYIYTKLSNKISTKVAT